MVGLVEDDHLDGTRVELLDSIFSDHIFSSATRNNFHLYYCFAEYAYDSSAQPRLARMRINVGS
jgi:hypothetical protein